MITQQNSTHKAVKEGRKITIYIKGIDFDGLIIEDEPLYSIPAENEDDLFEIFGSSIYAGREVRDTAMWVNES